MFVTPTSFDPPAESQWFHFIAGTFEVPDAPPSTWDDADLIGFIDAFDEDMKGLPEDAAVVWNKCTDMFFAAWLELHDRTA